MVRGAISVTPNRKSSSCSGPRRPARCRDTERRAMADVSRQPRARQCRQLQRGIRRSAWERAPRALVSRAAGRDGGRPHAGRLGRSRRAWCFPATSGVAAPPPGTRRPRGNASNGRTGGPSAHGSRCTGVHGVGQALVLQSELLQSDQGREGEGAVPLRARSVSPSREALDMPASAERACTPDEVRGRAVDASASPVIHRSRVAQEDVAGGPGPCRSVRVGGRAVRGLAPTRE